MLQIGCMCVRQSVSKHSFHAMMMVKSIKLPSSEHMNAVCYQISSYTCISWWHLIGCDVYKNLPGSFLRDQFTVSKG